MKQSKDAVRDEFERFVAEASPTLLRTAYLVLWDLPGAEDVVQESLFKVAQRWPRVRSMEHPVAYARRIVVHAALRGSTRRARHRAELGIDVAGGDPADDAHLRALGVVEYRHELVRAVVALPRQQRAALVLRYFEDLSEAQTADALGCSIGTVKSTTSRALERLRSELATTRRPNTEVSSMPPHAVVQEGAEQ